MSKDGLWNVGQLLSVIVGVVVAWEYTVAVGIAVAFVCQLLVDIRREIQELHT